MEINQVNNSFIQYQSVKQTGKKELFITIKNETSPLTGAVSISKETIKKKSLHESKFTKNSPMHVYTEEQKSIATIGSLKVRDPSIPLEKVYNRTRLEQHMYGQEHIGTYVELTKNPTTAIEEGLADYQAFIKRANVIVDEIKELDATNSLDISINGAGSVVINYKESLLKSGYIPDKAISDKEAISEWISGNSDKRHGLDDLARKYTLAKSIKGYESATGINRDELYEKYKESIKEGSSHYKAQEELNEYPFKISIYATMSFGTNPISYQAVDQMGTPGYVRNGRNHPKAKLPSMNGSY